MTALTLYTLASEYQEAAHRLAELDLPEEVIADTLEGLSGELEAKAVNVAMVARNLEAAADQIKLAELVMAERRKAMEARAKRLRAYLLDNMQRAGISKIESPHFSMSVRRNPPAVVVDSHNLIPSDYLRIPDPPPPELDKKKLAEALKAGVEVPGAHLEQAERLEIK